MSTTDVTVYDTVTLTPPIVVLADDRLESLVAAQGRVLVVVTGNRVHLYRRRGDGDFVCVFTENLNDEDGERPYGPTPQAWVGSPDDGDNEDEEHPR